MPVNLKRGIIKNLFVKLLLKQRQRVSNRYKQIIKKIY